MIGHSGLPGVAPHGIHDPNLFVDRRVLVDECARHGVVLRTNGLRPQVGAMLRWLATRRGEVRMVPDRITAVLYQGVGTKEAS